MLVLTIILWFLKTTIGAGHPEGNVQSTVRKKQVIQFPALGSSHPRRMLYGGELGGPQLPKILTAGVQLMED